MSTGPQFHNRTPEQIITQHLYYDSAGYIFRSLSWVDVAARHDSVPALYYVALEARLGIEQLIFEDLVLSVGTELHRKQYENCKGNATRLHKIVAQLNPDYGRLAEFTKMVMSTNPDVPPLVTWDHRDLMKKWGSLSEYLHWMAEPAETVDEPTWRKQAVHRVEAIAKTIWSNMNQGFHGILMPADMQPEIRSTWERFRSNEISLDVVRRIADITLPILKRRIIEA